jgi:hypothetical protein
MSEEDLLTFYRSEIFDSDLKAYLSNELVGTYIIGIYYPDIEFNGGYDDTGIHWTHYLIYVLKANYPSLYNNIKKKFNMDEDQLVNDKLSLNQERILIGVSTRLLSSEDKKKVGKDLADLTTYLISKRKSQIEELSKKIKNG